MTNHVNRPGWQTAWVSVVSALCLGVFANLLVAPTASAQLASQTALVGTVSDSTGAVLPGAQVVAVNVGTKDTYEATTNELGYYNIQFVRTGTYDITVTLSGFQTYKATGIDVGNNQVVRTNATLNAGGMVETVTVDARPPVLNTDSPVVGETIGARAIKDLPQNGRNVWNFAATTPGVLAGVNSDIGLSFRGAGQREIQNSLSLDGINASANLLASTSMKPIADAVAEMNVQTGSTSAEYGSYLGVFVNVVTKTGTNDLHGSVSHYYQGDPLDSHGYFDAAGTPKPPRKRNQFSVEGDGPVVLPGYDGRNKTFFMGAYEGVRSQAQTTSFATVPTDLMRQGNFSQISTAIKNPFTGQTFAGNIIPASMISPIAQKLLSYYPAANLPGTSSNVRGTRAVQDDADQVLVRGDQNLGNKIRMYARYNWYKTYNNPVEVVPTTSVTQPKVNKNTLFAYDHTLSPSLYNDFRIGYHDLTIDTLNYYYVNGVNDAGTALGIPGFVSDTAYQNPGIPSINITGFTGLGGGGTNWNQFDKTFQMSDVLSWNKGAHNVRLGFDLRRLETGRRAANDPRGRFDFTGTMTGNAFADFLLGLPRTVVNSTNQLWGDVGQWRNGFFVNDVWQAGHNLTLSLGLRYEMNTPVQTYSGQASALDETETVILNANATPGFQFTEPNRKDFGPRIGATYRLGEKTVVRAGYGIYYNPNQMNTFTFLTNNPPITSVATFTSDPANPTLSFLTPTGVATVITRPDIISPTRVLPNARKFQWSADVQRELAAGMALDVQYLGSNTDRLDRSFFDNTPTPGPGNVDDRRPSQLFRSRRIIKNDLTADYDAVTFILRKRMSHGLQLDAHYTWSRTRDEATNSNSGGAVMNNYDPMADYGPASWDVPHRFVATYIYDVPFLKTSENGFLRNVVAGWQVAGITTIQSGTPVNVTIGTDVANIGTGLQRPNLVGAVPSLNCQSDPATKNQINCFDASAFQLPAQYTFGNAPRNVLRGPKWVQTDLSLAKTVALAQTMRVEFHFDIFNAFNNVNFANPNGVFGTSSFGRISSLATGAAMRQMQLGVRFLF